MHRRTVGVVLLCISAFLYGIRYLSAAIFGSNVSSWNSQLYDSMLHYIGDGLLFWSRLSLIIGAGYLIFSEISEIDVKKVIKFIKGDWNETDENDYEDYQIKYELKKDRDINSDK